MILLYITTLNISITAVQKSTATLSFLYTLLGKRENAAVIYYNINMEIQYIKQKQSRSNSDYSTHP